MKAFIQFLLNKLYRKIETIHIADAVEEMPPVPELPIVPPPPTPRERLYTVAHALLTPGHDVSPKDRANDEVGCVESFCEVFKEAFGTYPDGTRQVPMLSTKAIKILFSGNPKRFKPTLDMLPGMIILSVTGEGNGKVSNGHIGILDEGGKIMSNNSENGNWDTHLTIEKWVGYYRNVGGMKIYLIEVI